MNKPKNDGEEPSTSVRAAAPTIKQLLKQVGNTPKVQLFLEVEGRQSHPEYFNRVAQLEVETLMKKDQLKKELKKIEIGYIQENGTGIPLGILSKIESYKKLRDITNLLKMIRKL